VWLPPGHRGVAWGALEACRGQGGKRVCSALFGFNGEVARGDRGARVLAQTSEESERGTRRGSGGAATIAYSAALSPPATAPARCL